MYKFAPFGGKLCMVLLLLNLAEYFAKAKTARVADNENDLDWWQTAVFYQIYPRSFKDGNGDGVGDLKGIEEKAEHFKDLGVDCIWLSPIFKSPMADFGYDISDYNDIDSTFGTIDDFVSLQKKLKSLGLKLILDFVPNHSSDEHDWFKKSVQRIDPYTDYYVWKDPKIDENGSNLPPNNWQSLFSNSAWTWNQERKQYYLHQFDPKQPDLNYRCKELVEEMKTNLRFWLDHGVDGYRVDAVPFLFEDPRFLDEPRMPEEIAAKQKNTHEQYEHIYTMDLNETFDMIKQFRGVLDEYKQKDGQTRVMITEAYTSLDNTMKYFGDKEAPGSHIPFNFGLISQLNDKSKASDFKSVVLEWLETMPPGSSANWVIGNHDQRRVATRFGPEMVDAMNMLNLLLPGTAFTYMGEEIGMEDSRIKWEQTVDPVGLNAGPEDFHLVSRDPARSPYQWDASENSGFTDNSTTWLPLNANYWKLNLAAQKEQSRSHYAVYKRLITLRKTRTIQRGSYEGDDLSEWVFAFSRSLPGSETYLVVINVGSEDQNVMLTDLSTVVDNWNVHTSSVNSQYSTGDTLSASGFQMRPKSALVLNTSSRDSKSSASLAQPSLMLGLALTYMCVRRYFDV